MTLDRPLDDELTSLTSAQRETYRRQVRQLQGPRLVMKHTALGFRFVTIRSLWRSHFPSHIAGWAIGGGYPLVLLGLAASEVIVARLPEAQMTDNAETTLGWAAAAAAVLLCAASTAVVAALKERQHANQPSERTATLNSFNWYWRSVARDNANQPHQLCTASGRERQSTSTSTAPASAGPMSPRTHHAPDRHRTTPTTGSMPSDGSGSSPRRSGNRSVPGGVFTPLLDSDDRRAIADDHGWICQLCLKEIPDVAYDYQNPHPLRLDIDHIIPRRHGGTDDWSNLQPVHHRCNLRKNSALITNEEFRRRDLHLESPLTSPSAAQSPTPGAMTNSAPATDMASDESFRSRAARFLARTNLSRGMRRPLEAHKAHLSQEQAERSEKFWATDHGQRLLTRCQRGHKFTEANTYYREEAGSGRISRECRACRSH